MSATPQPSPGSSLAVVTTGRLTIDNQSSALLGSSPFAIIPPPDPHGQWRTLDLDANTLSRISAVKLVELLADTSPEFSRALDDHMRLLNPGWDYHCFKPNTRDEDPKAMAVVGALFRRLRGYYGSVDVPINRNVIGLLLRGAWFGELVMAPDKRTALDLATPDAASARFRKVTDDQRGEIYQLGQWVGTEFRPLVYPTIKYVPYDPFSGSPYGRSPLSPGIFGSLFLMGFLHDIRRVIAQQGYPRIHISINLKRLIENIPQADRQNWKKIEEYGLALQKRIQDEYSKLRPEDAYVHSDIIEIDRPVGTLDASSLGMIEQVIGVLERMLMRALKSTPLMFGLDGGASDADATRQWEIYAARIKAMQHLSEAPMEDLIAYALQAEGIQADVEFRFAELRSAELLRDLQSEWQRIRNEREKYNAGWISQDEAAQAGADVDKADAPEPRVATLATTPQVSSDDEKPSARSADAETRDVPVAFGIYAASLDDAQYRRFCDSLRLGGFAESGLIALNRYRARAIAEREKLTPAGAGDGFADLPDEVDYTDDERDACRAAWDSAMPNYDGLLASEVINAADETTDESAA